MQTYQHATRKAHVVASFTLPSTRNSRIGHTLHPVSLVQVFHAVLRASPVHRDTAGIPGLEEAVKDLEEVQICCQACLVWRTAHPFWSSIFLKDPGVL